MMQGVEVSSLDYHDRASPTWLFGFMDGNPSIRNNYLYHAVGLELDVSSFVLVQTGLRCESFTARDGAPNARIQAVLTNCTILHKGVHFE